MKSPKQPEPVDPGKSMGEYLFGSDFHNYQGVTDPVLQERLLNAEATYRPQYTGLELADIQTMALGQGDQMGLFDLLENQARRASDLQSEQREADIADLERLGPQAVEAYRQADPYSTRLADLSQQQAETLYAEAEGELSPERRRMAEQAALQMSVAQGRGMDNSAIAGQLLGREQVRSRLRGEARQAGQMAYGQARGLYGDIGSTILERPTQSIGIGSQMLGQAQAGAAGQMGPQLFDPNVGINMALQNQANQTSYAGAQATQNAAMYGMLGSLGGAGLGMFNFGF